MSSADLVKFLSYESDSKASIVSLYSDIGADINAEALLPYEVKYIVILTFLGWLPGLCL